MRPKGPTICDHDIRVASVRVVVVDDLEALILRVGTHYVNLIRISVSLVGPFMLLLKLSMESGLFIVINLAKVTFVIYLYDNSLITVSIDIKTHPYRSLAKVITTAKTDYVTTALM